MIPVRALFAAAALFTGAAGAQERDDDEVAGARLSWVRAEGADECPGADDIARDVSARLGRDPFTGPVTQSVEAIVRREGDRWTARLYLRDASGALTGTREINGDGTTCAPIRGAAALAIALLIDPAVALRPTPALPAPVAIATVAPAPVVARPRPRAPRRAGALAVGLRALATAGSLPRVAAGIALSADLNLHPRVFLSTALWFLPEVRTADANYAFGLAAGSVAGCFVPLVGSRTSLATCAGVVLGAVHGAAYVYDPVPPGEHAWLAATVGARGRVALVGPLAAVAQLDLVVPITRQHFYVQNLAGTVFDQSAVGGAGQLGVELRFP